MKILKNKFITVSLALLTGVGTVAGVAGGILANNSVKMLTDDEKVLVSKKADQESVGPYIELTKWMCEKNVQPNYYHESLSKFDEGYIAFKDAHPLSHSYEKYVESIESTMLNNTDANAWIQNTKTDMVTNNTSVTTSASSQVARIKFIANADGSFDPALLKMLVDIVITNLEVSFPTMQYELESVKAIIDMAIDNNWTDKFGIETVTNGIFHILESALPSCYQIFWILNNSVDKIILTWENPDEMVKQLDGVFALTEGEMEKDPKAKVFIGLVQALNTTLDKVVEVLVPTPTPTPTPITPITEIIEGLVDKLIEAVISYYPEYTEYAYIFRDIVDDVLEATWENVNSIAKCFDKIFDTLNKFFPQLNTIWFILNNVIDLIVMNDFDRLTVWNELDGLIVLMEGQLPQYTAELEQAKSYIDAVCSDPVKYAFVKAFIELYIKGEIDKIRQSEYFGVMAKWLMKAIWSFLSPKADLWWYGQGGDMTQGGNGYYGYKLSNKVSYSKNFAWNKIQTGDEIYEEAGFNYLTGHTGIIDGIYYDIAHNELYVKGVEAYSPAGVQVSVWDEKRMDARDTVFAHVTKADNATRESAVNYMYSQLGHAYAISFDEQPSAKDLKNNTASWYCSELFYYAYKQAGYDVANYSFVKSYRTPIIGLPIALYDALGYLDGSKDWKFIPGDLNFLDIIFIGAGMMDPREINSSSLLKDYIHI
ncbi:MAG: hypothetical protein LBV48_00545 [Mycoplasmataceae bacterium]|nr:hypothetical protein [Mycoplasmataceae bacterium]